MSSLNYLKTFRKRWSLSQAELGMLLGNQSDLARSRIYLFEKGTRQPNIRTAFACEVIFGEHSSRTFPDFYAEVEAAVMRRAANLHRRLERRTDEKSLRKLELLQDMMRRAKSDLP